MSKGTYFCGSGYGWTNQENLAKQAARWAQNIRQLVRDKGVDALAFSGSSGAAVAFAVGSRIKIPLIYVRKKNEKSHGRPVECNLYRPIKNFLIVDDMICSGETVRHIYQSVMKHAASQRSEMACAGIWLYDTPFGDKTFTIGIKGREVHLPVFSVV